MWSKISKYDGLASYDDIITFRGKNPLEIFFCWISTNNLAKKMLDSLFCLEFNQKSENVVGNFVGSMVGEL